MPIGFAWVASQMGKALFWTELTSVLSANQQEAMERTFQSMLEHPATQALHYDCPCSKWEFLRYLLQNKSVVLHGSNRKDIEALEPREQTDCSGKPTTAVFASRDAIWPIFFAIVNTTIYRGSLRNGCWVVQGRGGEQRFYFFSVNAAMLAKDLWTEGVIYILPGETFQLTNHGVMRFDEWASREAVQPLGKLVVTPDDFPFLNRVAGHREGESMILSWLKYKSRCKKCADAARV